MSRRLGPKAKWALFVATAAAVAGLVLAAPQARAGGAPSQVTIGSSSSSSSSTSSSSTVPETILTIPTTTAKTPLTTAPHPTTSIAPPPTTAPAGNKGVVPTVAPPFTRTGPVTTTTVAVTTTIAGIGGRIPSAPATVPLRTTGTNGHVDPAFAWLSGIGFALALLIIVTRLIATRSGGRDRAPLA